MNKLLEKYYPHSYAIAVFLGIFIVYFPLVFFGIIYGDGGLFLTSQMRANKIGLAIFKDIPFWWLSDIIGGWGLRLTSNMGLIGAKLLGIIAYSFAGTITTYLIASEYRLKKSFIVSMLLAAFFTAFHHLFLNYYTIAMLLSLLFNFYFLKSIKNPKKVYYQLSCGLCLSFLIFSKISCFIALFLPIFSMLLCYFYDKKQLKIQFFSNLKIIFFSLSTILIIYGYFWHKNYISLVQEKLFLLNESHSSSYLIKIYLKDIFNVRLWFVVFCFLVLLSFFVFLLKRLRNVKKKGEKLIICFFFISLFLLFEARAITKIIDLITKSNLHSKLNVTPLIGTKIGYLTIICLFIFISVFLFIKNTKNSENKFHKTTLLCIGIYNLFIVGLFSNGGLASLIFGIWIICGLISTYIEESISLNANVLNKKILPLVKNYFWILCFLIGIHTIYSPLLCKKFAKHNFGKLKNIHENELQVKKAEALFAIIAQNANKEDQILCYPYFPIVYYATDTHPFQTHISFMYCSLSGLKKILKSFNASTVPPKLIVKHKKHKIFAEYFPLKHCKKTKLLEKKINEIWNLKLIWENECFEVYKPSIRKDL